jgi:hypothetical protein
MVLTVVLDTEHDVQYMRVGATRWRSSSLTRDVPVGLGWLIQPIIQDLPKQSPENTLRETREALGK